jgi:hypothetical protein
MSTDTYMDSKAGRRAEQWPKRAPEPRPKVSAVFGEGQTLYVRSMGKALRVLAVFTDNDECNAYCARVDKAAVVAEFGPFIFVADRYDGGTAIPEARR